MDQNKTDETQVDFTFEVTPQKAKLFREKIILSDGENLQGNNCILTLHSRVLGKSLQSPEATANSI